MLLQGTIDISTALESDADARALWQDRLTKLAAFPTFAKNGKTVFRYTEVGLDWNDGNAIGIQHIYPASQIGLGSDRGAADKRAEHGVGRWPAGATATARSRSIRRRRASVTTRTTS